MSAARGGVSPAAPLVPWRHLEHDVFRPTGELGFIGRSEHVVFQMTAKPPK
jgi:hypothetical protein